MDKPYDPLINMLKNLGNSLDLKTKADDILKNFDKHEMIKAIRACHRVTIKKDVELNKLDATVLYQLASTIMRKNQQQEMLGAILKRDDQGRYAEFFNVVVENNLIRYKEGNVFSASLQSGKIVFEEFNADTTGIFFLAEQNDLIDSSFIMQYPDGHFGLATTMKIKQYIDRVRQLTRQGKRTEQLYICAFDMDKTTFLNGEIIFEYDYMLVKYPLNLYIDALTEVQADEPAAEIGSDPTPEEMPKSDENAFDRISRQNTEKYTSNLEGEVGHFVETLLARCGSQPKDDENIGVTAKITLYKGLEVNKKDDYRVSSKIGLIEHAFLLNENNEFCGRFILEPFPMSKHEYYLTATADMLQKLNDLRNTQNDYSLLFLKGGEFNQSIKELMQNTDSPACLFKAVEIELRELEETETTLCIDFGTTNTSAGCYLDSHYISKLPIDSNARSNKSIAIDSLNFVNFFTASHELSTALITPTIIYVYQCDDPDNLRLLFGYEAKELIKQENYCSKATVFYGIKRWINNVELSEPIRDHFGNKQDVPRKTIMKYYFRYIIDTAEQQFKCKFKNLHLTTPVKLKAQYIELFEDILQGYHIESKNALDEGIAVLYNTIYEKVQGRKFDNDKEKKALVIDCGGGTTDLASCSYTVKEGPVSYEIEIKTAFENGDTNFGGNNITYRIMQYMKICFANYYMKNNKQIDIDSLIPVQSNDIFRFVDDQGIDNLYKMFEEHYDNAEKIIPTKYAEYEKKYLDEYNKVRNNFYFLWEIAEDMKKQFFEKTNMIRNTFGSEDNSQDNDLNIQKLSGWMLAVRENDELVEKSDFPNIIFNIKEIQKLIKGDIYNVIRKFLDKMFEDNQLTEYSTIKLTGQSCKIDIFKEALKEFVAGKAIEFKSSNEDDTMELKLVCLKGVIKYINAKKQGNITPTIVNEVPVIPYTLTTLNFKNTEEILLRNGLRVDQAKGKISKPLGFEEINFTLKAPENEKVAKELTTYEYFIKPNQYKAMRSEDIFSQYPITQLDIDSIRDNTVDVFVYGKGSHWGFNVLPIKKENQNIFVGKSKFFAFENEQSNINHFDGKK